MTDQAKSVTLNKALYATSVDGSSLETVSYLLDVGADPNAAYYVEWGYIPPKSALAAAANYQHFDVYEELLKRGDKSVYTVHGLPQ